MFLSNQNLHEAVELNNSEISKVETPITKSKKRSDIGIIFNGTQIGYRL